MPGHVNTFPKAEHLKGVIAVSNLFEKGKAKLNFPVRMVYLKSGTTPSIPVRAAFTVSKKNFKKAVDRNLLKRRMREAYRLNKSVLEKKGIQNIDVMFIYTTNEILPYQAIEKSICQLLNRLA